MSAQVALSRSAEELEGLIAVQQQRVEVLRRARDLRQQRKLLQQQLGAVDRELAALEEPLRGVLREPVAPR